MDWICRTWPGACLALACLGKESARRDWALRLLAGRETLLREKRRQAGEAAPEVRLALSRRRAEKYGGTAEFVQSNGVFRLSVLLCPEPFPQEN